MKKLLLFTFICSAFYGLAVAQCVTPTNAAVCAGNLVQLTANPGGTPNTFSNNSAVSMPGGQPATTSGIFGPYPSTVAVTGLATSGFSVANVTITGMNHTFTGDLDIILVSPTGQQVLLMSDVGGGSDLVNTTLTFADNGATFPTANPIPSGTYVPSSGGSGNFPAPGPGLVSAALPISTFTGNMNGTWNLYGVDDAGGDFGSFASWSITFTPAINVTWTGPAGTIFTNAAGTTPYVAGTSALSVFVKPTTASVYTANFSGGVCAGPQTVNVGINAPSACYCIPTGNLTCTSNDVITNVSVGTLNNASTCGTGGYTNYSTNPAIPVPTLIAGTTLPISVTVGPGGTEYVGVWIDYNQSGTFDPSEFTALGSGNGVTINGNITVPVTATLGVTRMRVRVRFSTPLLATEACATTGTFGEVEDYNVTIAPCVPLAVTTASTAQNVVCGSNATFTATVSGTTPVYQWQVQTAPGVFTNLTNTAPYSGVNTNTLLITNTTPALSGSIYRLVYSGACSSVNFTNPVALTVTPIAATVAQSPATLCAGGTTAQTITVTGGGTAVFTPSAGLFLDAAHTVPYAGTAVTTVYAFPTATTTYSFIRTNGACVSNSASITVTVNAALAGTPTLNAVTNLCANGSTTIAVSGITAGTALTYQYQVSTDGGLTFNNVSGANYTGGTTPTLTINNATGLTSGLVYRVVVSSASCGTMTNSNSSVLAVNPTPVVTISAIPNAVVAPGLPVTLSAGVGSGTGPFMYQFFLNGAPVSGSTTSPMFLADPNGAGAYTVTVTDAKGCTASSPSSLNVVLSPLASNTLFIYPSPNNGVFQVRYYNPTATRFITDAAMLNVFDNKGSRVFTQRYTLTGPFTQMNVNLGTHSAGLYRVELSDSRGNRLKTGTAMVF